MNSVKTLKPIMDWFDRNGWKPFPFQIETWENYLNGNSGLVQVPTGSGKTYAGYLGPLAELIAQPSKGLQILYVTPLRALARDITNSLWEPHKEMGLPFKVENRTGDLSSSRKKTQMKNPPETLVITPESLEVLLSYPDSKEIFKNLRCLIVDEWHELLGQKRGSLLELSIARLKIFQPNLKTWALTATIKNAQLAAQIVTQSESPLVIQSNMDRPIDVEVLLPASVDRFPWAGHMGLSMSKILADKLDPEVSTLIFTNTRNQAEKWYETLSLLKPEWEHILALHHSSLDKEDREIIEEGLKDGEIKIVVCTSSLDLGVDFQPVEKVVQIGSPKGIARFIQRAGRSAHAPGKRSKVLFVPTHALEIFEINALRKAMAEKDVEERRPRIEPFDVLIQHSMTCALAFPIDPEKFYAEVKSTWAFKNLSRLDFDRCLNFAATGGKSLTAYPQFQRLRKNEDGLLEPNHSLTTRLHRLNIGTITSESQISVVYMSSKKRLGLIEEHFAGKLKAGDVFQFAGKTLQFIRLQDMQAL
ncbi:MAG: DEAD/DEAH box helicase, partial [Bdellovibrionota bacterium]